MGEEFAHLVSAIIVVLWLGQLMCIELAVPS